VSCRRQKEDRSGGARSGRPSRPVWRQEKVLPKSLDSPLRRIFGPAVVASVTGRNQVFWCGNALRGTMCFITGVKAVARPRIRGTGNPLGIKSRVSARGSLRIGKKDQEGWIPGISNWGLWGRGGNWEILTPSSLASKSLTFAKGPVKA